MRKKIEYLPRLYSLSWDTENVALILKIEKYVIPFLSEVLLADNPFMNWIVKAHPVKHSFANIGQAGLPFGFEDRFEFYAEDEKSFSYIWRIVPAKYYTGNKCPKCDGNGGNEFGSSCFECRDTKLEIAFTKDTFNSSGLKTFYCLTSILSALLLDYVCDQDIGIEYSIEKQLIHLEIAPEAGYAKAHVGGWIDDSILKWIKVSPDSSEEPIIEAMKSVERKMWLREPDQYSFRFIWNGENFGLQVPGNACDVGTYYGDYSNLYGTGKALGCHNTDSSSQQMCFIAGFAKLHDLVED